MSAASTACFLVGIFAGGFPTGVNNIPSSFGGQLMGMLAFFPLAFLPGYIVSWILKKANLLRVPPEVELEGLDMAEFQQDFYPEFERVPETIVLPDGQEVESAPILIEAFGRLNGHHSGRHRGKEVAVIDSFPYDSWDEVATTFWTFGPENSTGTYILTVLGIIFMLAALDLLGLAREQEAGRPGRAPARRRRPAPGQPDGAGTRLRGAPARRALDRSRTVERRHDGS